MKNYNILSLTALRFILSLLLPTMLYSAGTLHFSTCSPLPLPNQLFSWSSSLCDVEQQEKIMKVEGGKEKEVINTILASSNNGACQVK